MHLVFNCEFTYRMDGVSLYFFFTLANSLRKLIDLKQNKVLFVLLFFYLRKEFKALH